LREKVARESAPDERYAMRENHGPVAKARSLRVGSTEAERKLWLLLRGRRLSIMKWRRQVPLGRYIVDFVCFERRLVVECDGSQHAESAHDEVRDAWLRQQGFTIARFWNHEVLNAPESVMDTILARAGLPF
jgi:very-short-patch-repair endonuclease